jgi:hypothetical protein
MGTGVILIVVGAILTFAVEDDVPGINLAVTGLILMVAGAAVVAYARNGSERRHTVVRRDDATGTGAEGTHVVEEIDRVRGVKPSRESSY